MMTGFSKLPCEIKENIFSWIRIRDLYEVSVVSEEWWWLTMKTYNVILSEDDLLIQTLLAFYNRKMELASPLMWFQLVKYANFSAIKLKHIPLRTVLKNCLESRRQIRSLWLQDKYGLVTNEGNLADAKLDIILNYFPHLKQLRLQNFIWDTNSVKIPERIKQVHLSKISLNGIPLMSLFEDPESIESLELGVTGLTFDHCVFKNLKRLSLQFKTPLPDDQMNSVLDLIRDHKNLRSVELVGPRITQEWFNLFGHSIEIITLKDIHIEIQLLAEMGTDGGYERRVMSFVCSDFRTIKRFTLADMSFVMSLDDQVNDIDIGIDYRGVYTCKPQMMEEKLSLELESFSRQVSTLTTTDAGPALREFNMICSGVKPEQLTNCVPASVKRLTLVLDGEIGNLSIGQLCEQPQNLEALNFHATDKTANLSIQRECFTSCTQLKFLKLRHVNRDGIQNLLQQCVSLQKLTLSEPERGYLTDLNATCVSQTIRELSLHESDANLKAVLDHFPNLEMLSLFSRRIRPTSMPTAISKLKRFSATFDRLKGIRNESTILAFLIDTVDVPCKLFYSNMDMSSFTFHLGWNASIIDNFEKTNGYAYCRGLPTRYLEARQIKIFDDLQHYVDIYR